MLKSKRLYRPHRKTVRRFITRRNIRKNALLLFVFGFLSLGVLGAGLSYLERSAKERGGRNGVTETESSVLDPINPFLSPPASPQLEVNQADDIEPATDCIRGSVKTRIEGDSHELPLVSTNGQRSE